MRKFSFSNFTFESLIRYIEGDVDSGSKLAIEEWLEADLGNRKLFDQLKKVWQNRSELSGLTGAVIEDDFRTIANKIHALQEERKGIKFRFGSISLLQRLAAAGLLLVTIGAAYYTGRLQSRHSDLAATGYTEIIVPKGQRSKVILSDGSSVWLNAGSCFRFSTNFSGETRDVWLDGEGLFNVAKDSTKLFYVHTENLDVKVHGTIFNLKAYSGDDIVETTVVEGLVSFESKSNKDISKRNVFLEPNHKAVYVISEKARVSEEVKREINRPLEPQKIIISEPIKVEPVISWAEGRLIFSDETLRNIAEKLEKKYDVHIQIDNEKLKDLRYTGVLKNVSIEQALKALQLTTGIQYVIDENNIRISERKSRI